MMCSFDVKYQIEAIMQDATAQGSISDIDALNLRLENQVQILLKSICFFMRKQVTLCSTNVLCINILIKKKCFII